MKKSEAFNLIVEKILRLEGGETVDTGGYTKFGISQKAYPGFDIKNLTREGAKQIYFKDYWKPLNCVYMPGLIACLVMDMGVNMGKKRAGKILQESINELKGYPILKVDGIIGIKTITGIVSVSGDMLLEFACVITLRRLKFYTKLAKREKYSKYLRGWVNRAAEILDYALKVFT